jgi:hypothetical protein
MATPRWTGHTSGTQNLLSSVIENKKLALQAQAQSDTASYRKQLLDFQQDEKARTEEWKETVATWRQEDKIRADELEIKKADIAETRHGDLINQAEQSRIFQGVQLFGGNPFKRNAKGDLEIISAVIKNKKTGEYEANPLALERNLSVDVEGKRFIPVQEIMYEKKFLAEVEKAIGLKKTTEAIDKRKEAERYLIDPMLLTPDEKGGLLGLGFNEEDAITDLLSKRDRIQDAALMMAHLEPTNTKRVSFINDVIALRNQLKGEKYESATEWKTEEGKAEWLAKRLALKNQMDEIIELLKHYNK